MKLFFRVWFVVLLIPSALSGTLLKIDGSIDVSFNGTGFNIVPSAGFAEGQAVVLDQRGGIVVAGRMDSIFAVIRFNADGSLDLNFGGTGTGFNTIPGTTRALDLVIDQEGRIVVVGADGIGDILVARFFANGVLDPSFGGTGTGFNTIPGTGGSIQAAIVLDSEKRIVVTGAAGGDLAVARLTSDGLIDANFGGNGTGINTIPGTDFGVSLVLDSQERIVVTGAAGGLLALARFTPDGLIDADFGGNGTGFNTIPGTVRGRNLILDTQERVVVVGVGGGSSMLIARFTSEGVLDPSFGGNETGINTVDTVGAVGEGLAGVVFDSQGRFVVTGTADPLSLTIARFTPDGLRDSTFGISGDGFSVFGTLNRAQGLVLDSQGRIVVTGFQSAINLFVARFFGEEFASDCALGIREKYCPL